MVAIIVLMAHGKNHNETGKVHPTISVQTAEYLKQLVDIGVYGNNPTAVAAYLIQRGIDDLIRTQVLTKLNPKK